MSGQVRVLIVEDHPLFRAGLASWLGEVVDTLVVAYSGPSVVEALNVHRQTPADCVILDLDLGDGRPPILNTADFVKAGCPVLIVSALADPTTLRGALQAGALGFVSKQAPPTEIKQAMQAVIAGDTYTSRDMAAILASGDASSVQLSERERTALVLYASGMKIDSVARQMGVKSSTAQEYIKRVREKYMKAGTPASTKTDLYRRAREDGIVS